MTTTGGLQQFHELLSTEILEEVRSWRLHPQLAQLHAKLDAITDEDTFLNTLAEAIVAMHLRARGCDLEFEVPTPQGRSADFGVNAFGQRFFVHVKRFSSDRPEERKLRLSSRLRILERIKRPYVVNIHFLPELSDQQMQRFVNDVATFISHARVGDEHAVIDERGLQIGTCSIVAPWKGSHVTLAIGLPSGSVGDAPRFLKLMNRAYRQFMPRAVNVVLIAVSHEDDLDDFDTALLGSHIERWDATPPPGQRVAHGRAPDGFWSSGQSVDSAAVGWFMLPPQVDGYRGRLNLRQGSAFDANLRRTLLRLFETWPTEPS